MPDVPAFTFTEAVTFDTTLCTYAVTVANENPYDGVFCFAQSPFGLCDSIGMEGVSEIATLVDIAPWGTIPGYGTAIGAIADAVAAGATELNILRMYFETEEISTSQTLWATGANALNLGVGNVANLIGVAPVLGTLGNVVGSALEFIIASWTAGITSPQP
jgi:hypothetical protein